MFKEKKEKKKKKINIIREYDMNNCYQINNGPFHFYCEEIKGRKRIHYISEREIMLYIRCLSVLVEGRKKRSV